MERGTRRLILFGVIFGCVLQMGAQPWFNLMYEREDSTYIIDYRRDLNIRGMTVFEKNVIAVFDESAADRAILYQSNPPIPKYGVGFSYRWANLDLFGPLPGLSYQDPKRGNTVNGGIGIGITLPKIWFRTALENYKGYYLAPGSTLFPGATNPRIRDDIQTSTYFASVYYGFNGNKYSHRSTIWHSEGQIRSAGSLMIGLTFTFQAVRADSSLTELDPIRTGSFLRQPEDIDNTSLGASIGYAYTWAINPHWYLTGMIVPGLSYVWKSQTTETGEVFHDESIGGFTEIRIVAGYHSPRWFFGTGVTTYGLGEREASNNRMGINTLNYARLFLGYRFRIKPIKFLEPFDLSN
ncbi:MAG: DUF4421 domain-containing protein [Bacteroidota bacterium]|nr:DUF4421 domain-containing protein [Bacteroidota bacterium]